MNKLVSCVFMVCWCSLTAWSQQEPLFTQFFNVKPLINPAATSASGNIELGFVSRFQYTNLSHRLTSTQGFDFGLPIPRISSALGIALVNDFTGYQRTTYLNLQYAYRKEVHSWNLAAGIGIGFTQASLSGDKLRAPDGEYSQGLFNHNDAFIPSGKTRAIAPDMNIGLWISNEAFFGGVAIRQLLFLPTQHITDAGETKLRYPVNMNITAGYNFFISEKFSLQPSLIVRTDFKQFQFDVNVLTTTLRNILIGFSFRGFTKRSFDSISGMAGYKIKGKYTVLYSYDGSTSALRNFSAGSHEISIRVPIAIKNKELKGYFYYLPRYLSLQ